MKQTMKKIWSCAILLAAVLLTGCNNVEDTLFTGEGTQTEKGKLSFVIPMGGNKTVTYAGTDVIGEDSEYAIERLMIFWFKDGASSSASTDILYKRFGHGSGTTSFNPIDPDPDPINLTKTNNTTIATIDVGEDNFPSKFYIVANVNGSSITSKAALQVIPGTTTRADFEALLSDSLALVAGTAVGEIVPIKTPLPMSIKTDGPNTTGGFVAMSDLTDPAPAEIHLKRRVARFDIVNNADYTNFSVTKVHVARAQRNGWLHDIAFNKGTLPAVSLPTWANYGATGNVGNLTYDLTGKADGTPCVDKTVDTDKDNIPDEFQDLPGKPHTRDSLQINGPLFYLHPTVLDKAGAMTEITVEGKFSNSDRIYRLNLPANGINVEANKVYRIVVDRAVSHDVALNLVVVHWADSVEVHANGDDKDVVYSSFTGAGQTLSIDKGNSNPQFEYCSADSVEVTIVTEGSVLDSQYGGTTMVSINPAASGNEPTDNAIFAGDYIGRLVKSESKLTYGTRFITTHTIKLPPTNAPFRAVLTLTNSGNPDESANVPIFSNNYGKTGYKPVTVSWTDNSTTPATQRTLLWAPVNVGATNLPATKGAIASDSTGFAITGYHYQWGRSYYALRPDKTPTTVTGPLSAADAANDANKNAFIKGATSSSDWMTPLDATRWTGANAQGPCPPGWRVPTKDECLVIYNGQASVTGTSIWKSFAGSDGTLYIPYNGYRMAVTGNLQGYATTDYFLWTSTDSETTPGLYYRWYGAGVTAVIGGANGGGVRAVRDVTAP